LNRRHKKDGGFRRVPVELANNIVVSAFQLGFYWSKPGSFMKAYSTFLSFAALLFGMGLHAAESNTWTTASEAGPMSVREARTFMRELAGFVFDHHLKRAAASPQRGMIYEYYDTSRAGTLGQWVQGEALDTMHDGAWFAAAMVNAYRATGDPYYKQFLTEWILPFYIRMLNSSGTLFSATRDDSRTNAHRFDREHQIQAGEKGFVPYWWDDGASVSLERIRDRNPRGPFSCTDEIPPGQNTNKVLKGYSHGSSNHMAQDLAVMLELAWLLLSDSKDSSDIKLAAQLAEAAQNLHESRVRHHGPIPMVAAAAALMTGNRAAMARIRSYEDLAWRRPENHFTRALYSFEPGKRAAFPGFADDQQYLYYGALAKHRTLPPTLAFKLTYDALTEPMLFQYYCDDLPLVPGLNRFDLHPYSASGGKLDDYRSDRKGPSKQPRPAGSRFGPQNMVVCGWALQALRAHGDLWEQRAVGTENDQPVFIHDYPPGQGSDLQPPFAQFKVGEVTLGIASSRRALHLRGEFLRPFELRLFNRPDATGNLVRVSVTRDKVLVINSQGDELLLDEHLIERPGNVTRFRISIPYAVIKEQRTWWTGVPHARCSVKVNDFVQNLYFTSEEEQVKRWLTWELSGGLRTWEKVFRTRGYIPTSLGAGPSWDSLSDSGGYAHLISAAAQWVFLLEGKRDWELHLHQAPKSPGN
jgi:hypothetical protein